MYTVQIEIVGTCNLRCPSCAVGNSDDRRQTGSIGGTMPPDTFRQTLDWLDEGLGRDPGQVMLYLYSWGEPFIHTGLAQLIAQAKARGYVVGLSSNLNHVHDLDAVIAAGVDEIVVSLSGFTQEVYGIGHAGGDIERVKRHMAALSRAIDAAGAHTRVMVHYITYRHNLGAGEFAAMAAYCDSLGFEFEPSLAYFVPVEKVVVMAEGRIADRDRAILDRLIVPLDEQLRMAAPKAGSAPCPLIEDRLDIDVDGALKLCCSSYDRRFNVAGHFSGVTMDEAKRRRRASPLCGECAGHGIDRIYTRADYADWCAYANAVFAERDAPVRFIGSTLVSGTDRTEAMLLAMVEHDLNGGRVDEAARTFEDLRLRLAARYGEGSSHAEGVLAAAEEGRNRLGRDIPRDPLRVFFADALIAAIHLNDRNRARAIALTLGRLEPRLRPLGVYRRVCETMAPMIAQMQDSLAQPAPPSPKVRQHWLRRLFGPHA